MTADLSKNSVVQETFQRNAFKYGFSYNDSQYFGSYFKKLLNMFVKIKFITCRWTVAKRQDIELRAEDFVDAEGHPFSEKSSCVCGVFLVFEADLYFFVKIDILELWVAGHEKVVPIDFEHFWFSFSKMYPEQFEILTEPFVFFLKTASAHEITGFFEYLGRNWILWFHGPLKLRPIF